MRAAIPPTLGVIAGVLVAAGCAPTVQTARQANAQLRELRDANDRAQSAALARAARRWGVRFRAQPSTRFAADQSALDACGETANAGRALRLTSSESKLAVTVFCNQVDPPRTLWAGTLPDGSPVVLIRGEFSFALQGRRVLVFDAVPRFTRREPVVYPGSCDEMPHPVPLGQDLSFAVFRNRTPADFHFVPVPYDAVDIDKTCQFPRS